MVIMHSLSLLEVEVICNYKEGMWIGYCVIIHFI